MKKLQQALVLGILVAGLMALWAFDRAAPAYATGGPHGDYSAITDFCAACHRVHTAPGTSKLLKDPVSGTGQRALNLCVSCHNGSGSALDVMDGLRIDLAGTGGYTVPSAASATQLEVSVESATVIGPTAKSLTTTATDSTTYSVRVKNKSGAAITGTITRAQSNAVATQFDTDTLSVTTFTTLAAGGSVYTILTVGTGTAATAGSVNLSTVTATVTASGENAAVKVNTRIGSWALLGGGYSYVDGVATTSSHFNAQTGAEQAADDTKKPWGYAGTTGVTRDSYMNIAAGATWTATDTNPGQTGMRPGDLLANKLECISCHNPHGSANYRMLNLTVNAYNVNVKAWSGSATVYNDGVGASELARRGLDGATGAAVSKYTTAYENYYSVGSNVLVEANLTQGVNDTNANWSSFCSACHTAYPSLTAQGGLTAQSLTRYRHRTEAAITGRPGGPSLVNPETVGYGGYTLRLASSSVSANEFVTCTTCHRSHGTAVSMSSYSQGANTASGGGVASGKSSLLFLADRGVCQVCHQW